MRQIHVLPIDDDHAESESCVCNPIRSLTIGDDTIVVHRPANQTYVDPSPFVPLRVLRPDD